jgi:hypothetical protein
MALDPSGAAVASGGFNCRLRDLARFASHPLVGNVHLDPTSLPGYRAIADQLLRKPR